MPDKEVVLPDAATDAPTEIPTRPAGPGLFSTKALALLAVTVVLRSVVGPCATIPAPSNELALSLIVELFTIS